MSFRKQVKKVLHKQGIEITRYPGPEMERRMRLFRNFNINTVFDVGANAGQYASLLLELGYNGRIISFEPLSSAYGQLVKSSGKSAKWETRNMAIGDSDGEIEINISENSYSSSILSMLPDHLASAPESRYINKEKVAIHKLDTIYKDLVGDNDNVYLKIDTQGYEKTVLDGADEFLQKVKGVQLEMSIVPLYSNELLFQDMILFLQSKGFNLYSLEPGFSSPQTGRLLQVDGIFFRDGK